MNWDWTEDALDSLPQQEPANDNQATELKMLAEKITRHPQGQNESQIQGYKSHLIGKVVNAIHDQAKALSLQSGDCLNDKNPRIERNSSREAFHL